MNKLLLLVLVSAGLAAVNASCANTPTAALNAPTVTLPKVIDNDYEFAVEFHIGFDDNVKVHFDEGNANPCDYDEADLAAAKTTAGWTDDTDLTDCYNNATFRRTVQDMLATCGFPRQLINDEYVYQRTISIITDQQRSINQGTGGSRAITWTQTKTTHFTLRLIVPTKITYSHSITVINTVAVLAALTNQDVRQADPKYELDFDVLTSSQYPYQLKFVGVESADAELDLSGIVANSGNVRPNCTTTEGDPCVQNFAFTGSLIDTTCPTKDQLLNDNITLTFNTTCQDQVTGGCTPSPPQVFISFLLSSTKYCPRAENLNLNGVMKTYRNVALDTSDWTSTSESTQFVIGATIFGEVELTVEETVATIDSSVIKTLTTTTSEAPVTLFSSDTNHFPSSLAIDNGNAGGTQFPDNKANVRFSILLVNGETVALNQDIEASQAAEITAYIEVGYITQSVKTNNPILQDMHAKNNIKSRNIKVLNSAEQSASAKVSLTGTSTAPSAGASTSGGFSMMAVAGVVAAVAVIFVLAAYKVGRRSEEVKYDEEEDEMLSQQSTTVTDNSVDGDQA